VQKVNTILKRFAENKYKPENLLSYGFARLDPYEVSVVQLIVLNLACLVAQQSCDAWRLRLFLLALKHLICDVITTAGSDAAVLNILRCRWTTYLSQRN